jgi:hypothetical protein
MIRAIQLGTKIQTRRVANVIWDTSKYWGDYDCWTFRLGRQTKPCIGFSTENNGQSTLVGHCPYGRVGDRLWVKETCIIAPKHFATPDSTCIADAEGDLRYIQYLATSPDREGADGYGLKATPSIFMPRWASRFTLEVVAVRIQRLQEISEEDALAEGIRVVSKDHRWRPDAFTFGDNLSAWWPTARNAFAALWTSINGARNGFAWADDPWVWAMAFKVLNHQLGGAA